MQFLVTAYDGKDENAPARRQAVRQQHLRGAEEMHKTGEMLYAAAILNDDGGMAGSVLVMDFENRAALQKWLDSEPYVTGGVWREIRVEPCAVPGFIKRP